MAISALAHEKWRWIVPMNENECDVPHDTIRLNYKVSLWLLRLGKENVKIVKYAETILPSTRLNPLPLSLLYSHYSLTLPLFYHPNLHIYLIRPPKTY